MIRKITDYCVEVANLDHRVRYLWVTRCRDEESCYHCAFVVENRTIVITIPITTVSAQEPKTTLQQILGAATV